MAIRQAQRVGSGPHAGLVLTATCLGPGGALARACQPPVVVTKHTVLCRSKTTEHASLNKKKLAGQFFLCWPLLEQ